MCGLHLYHRVRAPLSPLSTSMRVLVRSNMTLEVETHMHLASHNLITVVMGYTGKSLGWVFPTKL